MTTIPGLAVVQFAPVADVTANLATMNRLAELAVSRGASLVVFPEYSSWFTPDMESAWLDAAQDLHGEFVTGVAAMGVRLGIHVVAGFIERTDDPARIANSLVAVDASGTIVATYSKLHLYDAFGGRESDWVKPGSIEAPQTFGWGELTVGLQTCYDLRFPEVTRRIVDAGANVVLVPSEWVRGPLKEHHWRTLVTARAIENTVYVAAADHAPPVGVGNSMVVDPMGVELATIGEIEDVAVAWPTLQRIVDVRETNPSLAHRRFGIVPN